jgi:hypothetical protein
MKTSSSVVVEIVYLLILYFSLYSSIYSNILFISLLSFVLKLICNKLFELILINILGTISFNSFINCSLFSLLKFSSIIKFKLKQFRYLFFKKEEVPEHLYLPSLIIPILSLKNSASSKE